jgi:hypothetical protein
MEGSEKAHTDKYKKITNNWNYDASRMLTSLPVSDPENFKSLIFVTKKSTMYPLYKGFYTKMFLQV